MSTPSADRFGKGNPLKLSRRQFLRFAALFGGASALGTQTLNALAQSVGAAASQARKFFPTFSADANSFGRLVGLDGNALPGGAPLEQLATGLLASTPPLGLVVIVGIVVGGVWLTYGYIVLLLLQVASGR